MKLKEQDIVPGPATLEVKRVLVSIITIINEDDALFLDTANSVFRQTYQHFEWIITNESGNTDEIKRQSYEDLMADKRIIFLPLKTKNRAGILNAAIEESKGDFIFFLDAADELVPTALEKLLLTIKINSDLDFVNSYSRMPANGGSVVKKGFYEKELFLKENRNPNSFLAKAGIFKTINFDETAGDATLYWEFWLNSALHGYWGYTIPEVLCLQRDERFKLKQALSKQVKTRLKIKYGDKLVRNGFPDKKLAVFNFERQIDDMTLSAGLDRYINEKSILFLLPFLDVGGADKFNLDLVTGLRERNWHITIACTLQNDNIWLDHFINHTTDIFLLPNYSNDSQYFKALYQLIVTRKPSVIFLSHSLYGYYIIPYIKKRFPGIAIVDYLHCEAPGWYNGGYPFISTLYQKLLDKTFVSSQHLKDWYISRGGDKDKAGVCYININAGETSRNELNRERIRSGLQISSQTPVLLFVGRLTSQKQPLVLLKSIEKLYKRQKNFYCIIIGDGPDKNALLKGIKKSPAKQLILYSGAQSNERVKEYMDAADLLFLPSAFEGIALSIYEAMSKSMAIVAADVGGQKELVTPECGFLVKRSNAESESDEYADILYSITSDPAQLAQMGINSRNRVVKEFALSEMIVKIDGALQSIIRSGTQAENEISGQYLLILNRLVFQTHFNDVLWAHSKGRFNTTLNRYRRYYNLTRKIYHKLKEMFFS